MVFSIFVVLLNNMKNERKNLREWLKYVSSFEMIFFIKFVDEIFYFLNFPEPSFKGIKFIKEKVRDKFLDEMIRIKFLF